MHEKLGAGSPGKRDLRMGNLAAFGQLRDHLVGKRIRPVWGWYQPITGPMGRTVTKASRAAER